MKSKEFGRAVPAAVFAEPASQDTQQRVPPVRFQRKHGCQESFGQHGSRFTAQESCDGPRHLVHAGALAGGDNAAAQRTCPLVCRLKAKELRWLADYQSPAQLLDIRKQGIVNPEPRNGRETVLGDLHELGVEQPPPLEHLANRAVVSRAINPDALNHPHLCRPGGRQTLG
ncbi:hypothetical protein D3C73_1291580 [compost metagenome]